MINNITLLRIDYIDGLVQDCSNSSPNELSNHRRLDCLPNHLSRFISTLRKHQNSASLAFVRGNPPLTGPVVSPYKGPVTRKLFPFDVTIMMYQDLPNEPLYLEKAVRILPCLLYTRKRYARSGWLPQIKSPVPWVTQFRLFKASRVLQVKNMLCIHTGNYNGFGNYDRNSTSARFLFMPWQSP